MPGIAGPLGTSLDLGIQPQENTAEWKGRQVMAKLE